MKLSKKKGMNKSMKLHDLFHLKELINVDYRNTWTLSYERYHQKMKTRMAKLNGIKLREYLLKRRYIDMIILYHESIIRNKIELKNILNYDIKYDDKTYWRIISQNNNNICGIKYHKINDKYILINNIIQLDIKRIIRIVHMIPYFYDGIFTKNEYIKNKCYFTSNPFCSLIKFK